MLRLAGEPSEFDRLLAEVGLTVCCRSSSPVGARENIAALTGTPPAGAVCRPNVCSSPPRSLGVEVALVFGPVNDARSASGNGRVNGCFVPSILVEPKRNRPAVVDYHRPVENEVAILRNVMVPMRDGVHLATDLYHPSRDGELLPGPFPVIVDRTPYEKIPRAARANDPEYFAERGYVFVFQDTRGHGHSEGEYKLYVREGDDGCDAIEWVARQPWCNSKIGMSGYSHDAATQNAVAAAGSPHLTSIFPAFCSSSYHNDVAGHGGAQRLSHNFVYTVLHALLDHVVSDSPDLQASMSEIEEHMFEWFKVPQEKHLRLFRDVPRAATWYREWLDHPDLDDYWKQNGYFYERFYDDYPDVPAFFMGGFYDFCLLGTTTNYNGLAAALSSKPHLMLGPWCHGPMNARRRSAGTVDFGASSYVDWNPVRLAFFDESLRGVDTGLFGRDRSVNVFVMGGGSGTKDSDGLIDHGGYWISGPSWPLPGTTFTEYHLRPAGALTTEPEGTTGSVSFAYDPDDPVLQIGGDYTYPFGLGPLDQIGQPRVLGSTDTMPLSARPDVLVFETEPLIEDVEVVGPIRVELYVSSDAPDTDFTAKLIDQYPPSVYYPGGYAMLLTDSIRRLRYRDSLEWTTPYTPGDVVAVEIDVRVTANVFKVGHRIRLDVSSSCFPSFDPNPNTGEPIGRHTHTRVANNTVHFSGSHRSRLILPIRNQEPPNKARGATDL